MKRFLTGLLLLAAFGAGLVNAASPGDLLITDPRVRAMPPGSKNTAAYMGIKNLSKQDVVITGVRSSLTRTAMIHNTVKKNGKMTMVHQMSVTVPAGKRVKFKPGGLHFMLMGLDKNLTTGEVVNLELVLKGGQVVKVKAPVKKQVTDMGNLSG